MADRRATSNRRNAERSTGPRTREGKQRSAQNSFRHGFAARIHQSDGDEALRSMIDATRLAFPDGLHGEDLCHVWAEERLRLDAILHQRSLHIEYLDYLVNSPAGTGCSEGGARTTQPGESIGQILREIQRLERYDLRSRSRIRQKLQE